VDAKGSVTGGFDVIIGNPPFAGKNNLISAHADGYLDWLRQIHEESHGNADLVAHFFRRAFTLLRPSGCFGLIATNTIGQGDTRSTGLRWICAHQGTIYQARKRLRWPGQAAVVVSVVHVSKGNLSGPFFLDGKEVPIITAYLFHAGGHEDPARLQANQSKSFIGCFLLGLGFTFDDTDTKGVASPISLMHELIAKDPRNAERIFPYIGGEELNTHPTQLNHRWAICFEEMTEQQARQWPDLMSIVEEKVKPARMKLGDKADAQRRKKHWWLYGRYTPGLFSAIRGLDRVLAIAFTSRTLAFVHQPSNRIFEHSVVVFADDSFPFFAVLQSRIHEIWARFFGSTMKDDACYTPSACFQTFPFPQNFGSLPVLAKTGRDYYEFRAGLMVKNTEGLTATYNRFNDPEEDSPDILRLRELHAAMDRAVLDAYGWTDIQPKREFLLEYEEEEDEEENGPRRRKKPWRYWWPDEIRDEVLARLLELNRQRALEEGQVVVAAESASSVTAKRKRGKKTAPAAAGAALIGSDPE
jgi:hypothetical protein